MRGYGDELTDLRSKAEIASFRIPGSLEESVTPMNGHRLRRRAAARMSRGSSAGREKKIQIDPITHTLKLEDINRGFDLRQIGELGRNWLLSPDHATGLLRYDENRPIQSMTKAIVRYISSGAPLFKQVLEIA